MNKVFAIIISGLIAWLVVASLGGGETAVASPAPAAVGPRITAWRCPITDKFFASPITCKANCFGFTCQAVTQ